MATWVEQQLAENRDLKELQRESTILEATELICAAMQDRDINRTQLAARLGKTKGYVTQLLNGNANMTLSTLSDVFTALGASLQLGYVPLPDAMRIEQQSPPDGSVRKAHKGSSPGKRHERIKPAPKPKDDRSKESRGERKKVTRDGTAREA